MTADGTVGYTEVLNTASLVVQIIFAVECAIKLVAEGLTPWTYLLTSWNVFDAGVVIGSFFDGEGNLVLMLRVLRMLRVIKLMRSLPQLQIIVTSLVNGFGSIGYASLLLGLFFYFFGIIANIIFAKNDPWRFGTLHMTMATLFQIITLDNWNDVMYTNMFGCDVYGYWYFPWFCTHPEAQFTLTVLYFSVFIVLGAMVLLSLFIGVVTNSLEEATKEFQTNQKCELKLRRIALKYNISEKAVQLYTAIFEMMDADRDHLLDKEEFGGGFTTVGSQIDAFELSLLWSKVPKNNDSCIDLSEFVLAMLLLRKDKAVFFENDPGADAELNSILQASRSRSRSALKSSKSMKAVRSIKKQISEKDSVGDHNPYDQRPPRATPALMKKEDVRVTYNDVQKDRHISGKRFENKSGKIVEEDIADVMEADVDSKCNDLEVTPIDDTPLSDDNFVPVSKSTIMKDGSPRMPDPPPVVAQALGNEKSS